MIIARKTIVLVSISFELSASSHSSSVPIFDGRRHSLNFQELYPFASLPRLDDELCPGDVVWFGFRSELEQEIQASPVGKACNYVCWLVLLSKGANCGPRVQITDPVDEDSWAERFIHLN